MLAQLTLSEFLNLVKTAKKVAVCREIIADKLTVVEIIENLASALADGMVLESTLQNEDGRYSFVAFDVMAEYRVHHGMIYYHTGPDVIELLGDPLEKLRECHQQQLCAMQPEVKPFIGSAMGYLAYDAVRLFETIPDQHSQEDSFPEMAFRYYRTTLVFDHHRQTVLLGTIVDIGATPEENYNQAMQTLDQLVRTIFKNTEQPIQPSQTQQQKTAVIVDIDDPHFMQLVNQAKHHIAQGDAFQIVLSRRFQKKCTVSPLDVYRVLRRSASVPYLFYMPMLNRVMVGASPEKLISVRDRHITINPIAGTRKRIDTLHDSDIEKELLTDKKELAEHKMLVDLARNDLGAVCEPGTVIVKELSKVKHYSHVSHLVSIVTGLLQKNNDVFDALKSVFPAGTLSGAPKIRAMEIIDALETSRRGLYGGAICRIDALGNLDSCIAIRMAVIQDGIATVRTGAGIVHDSDPQQEADETRHKAAGMLMTLAIAEGECA